MLTTAKVFTNGHSQAIRLPKAFRVDVQEMWIAKNEVTGEITLTPKEDEDLRKRNLEKLFKMIADGAMRHCAIPWQSGLRTPRQMVPKSDPLFGRHQYPGLPHATHVRATAAAHAAGHARTGNCHIGHHPG